MRSDPPVRATLDDVLAHSYADFHVKGFDYLCLKRTPELTIKAYFFDGDVSAAPEVVIPHDHRYPFGTFVISGASRNRTFAPASPGSPAARAYEAFDYLTVLNGGDGFTWRETTWLRQLGERYYGAGDGYVMLPEEIHTIQIAEPDTVLMLVQGADKVPVGTPTTAYRPDGERGGPSLSGLYREMEPDHALARIAQLQAIRPGMFEVIQ